MKTMKLNKGLLLSLAFLLNGLSIFAQPTFEWANSLGGNGNDFTVKDQVVDVNGDTYTVGEFKGTIDFDPSPTTNYFIASVGTGNNMFITKLDASGNFAWAVSIGNTGNTIVNDIDLDPNGFILMAGLFGGTLDVDPGPGTNNIVSTAAAAFVLKLTTAATFVWARSTVSRTEAVGACFDSNGNVFVALNTINAGPGLNADFPGGFSFASANYEFFMWKLSPVGVTQWVKQGSSNNLNTLPPRSIIAENSGNILMTGIYNANLELQFFPGGPNNVAGVGSINSFVVKVRASDGFYVWHRAFSNGSVTARVIHKVDNTTFMIGGFFSGTSTFAPGSHTYTSAGNNDGFFLEMDFNNTFLTSYAFGGSSQESVEGLSSDYLGGRYASGKFAGTSDMDASVGTYNLVSTGGTFDAFLLKVNPGGSFAWALGYGSTTNEDVMNVVNNYSDKIYCAGMFVGTVDFNHEAPIFNLTSNSATKFSGFRLKLGQCLGGSPIPTVGNLSDLTGTCSVAAPVAPTATNCFGTFNGTPNVSFPITAVGTTIVTWTYDDGNGGTSTQTQNVVITDAIAPVANVASLSNVTGSCSVTSLTAPTATDNCAGTITGTHNASLPITAQGTTTITWTYNDGNGNTSTQTQNVVITDATAPVANVATLSNVTSECSVTSLAAPTATDNCAGVITGTHNATLPITFQGTTTVTWTYNDGNGNTSTQTQNVVIDDVTAPVANVASLSNVTGSCSVTSLTAPTATDNCAGTITGTHNATLPITTQGTTTVTWTYNDGNGNTSTQTQNVVVSDVTAPVANQASLAAIVANCGQSVTSLTAPTASDNCAGTVTGTHNSSLPITSSTTITWTYNDGNGNISTQNQTITINVDNVAPVANVATLSNVTSECSVTSLTAPTATDNCAGVITGTHNATLPITFQGTTTVTWTYNDGNGNTSTQTQNVVVSDVTAPVANQASLAAIVTNCGQSVTSLTAPTATDNCAGTITGTHNASLPITSSTTITWTYNDGNGNTSTQNQTVTINVDNVAPVANVATLSNVTSECSVTSLTAPTATDNCAGTITGTHNATLPITAQGTTTITWTYDDGNGNISTQTQDVVIDDVTLPIADAANLTDINSECEVTPSTPIATDNCAGTITGTPDVTFPITASGTTLVTWTYNDGNGNTSTQTQNVVITPIDNGITQNDAITLSADASGYSYQWVDCANGNQAIAGATNQTFVATVNGNYAVEIDNGTCMVTSDCIVINSVGIKEFVNNELVAVYPNPTNGSITIASGASFNRVEVLNAIGQKVSDYEISETSNYSLTLPAENGVYILKVYSNGSQVIKRVVKQ